MRVGVHISTGGDLGRAPEIAKELSCETMQIFSGNPRGYVKPPLKPETVSAFKAGVESGGIRPIVVHATYLINLAAPKDDVYRLSVESFLDELGRTRDLGCEFYVLHIGNHGGAGMEEGRRRVAEAFKRAFAEVDRCPKILVENTSGSGTSLGGTFEDIAALFDAVGGRVGLCFDTCHALAAGYEIRTPDGAGKTLDTACRLLGRESLLCIHVNDSKGELGSHIDRHEHLGLGEIGEEGFRAFFSDARLADLPAILETPKEPEGADERNLAALRALISGAPMPGVAWGTAAGGRRKARKGKNTAGGESGIGVSEKSETRDAAPRRPGRDGQAGSSVSGSGRMQGKTRTVEGKRPGGRKQR